ncbi:hypothetical protein [Nocardiopsis salina]|uniref:hypothetical protein n=1 Tax=Nocardiopsis salina TaxID=245836 RepID=UPI000347A383|nr:hypothetical protein [Nocardiopsis salina]
MADAESPLKDKNYNLIWAVHQSLENVWRLDSYIKDAERQGDDELVRWFRRSRRITRRLVSKERKCSSTAFRRKKVEPVFLGRFG